MGDSGPVDLEIQSVGGEGQPLVLAIDHELRIAEVFEVGKRSDHDLGTDSQRIPHRDADGGDDWMILFAYHGFILVALPGEGL